MSEQRKNFWIFLTAFAMVFAVSKWLYQQQSEQVIVTKRSCVKTKRNCRSQHQNRVEYQSRHHQRRRCNLQKRQQQHPAIDDFVFVDKEPIATNYRLVKTRMGYPLSLFGTHTNGRVVVRVLVDEQGKYQRHQILSQTHSAFAKQAEPHLHKLTFQPAKKDGKAISYWVNIPFHFNN